MSRVVPAIININDSGEIIGFSSAAELLFGWAASEVIGMSVVYLIPDLLKRAPLIFGDVEQGTVRQAITRPYPLQARCRDGLTIRVKVSASRWHSGVQQFITLLVDTPDVAEGYAASLMNEIELVQEVALWVGLPAVIERVAGWFERAHPGSRMWLRVQDAEGECHVATSPKLPRVLSKALNDTPNSTVETVTLKALAPFTDLVGDLTWPEAIRSAALESGLRFGGLQLISLQSCQTVGALAVFCPANPAEAQPLHALDKATELVVLAAELGRTELRAREARGAFSALLNAAVDAIIVIDDQGRVVTLNTAVERIFGYHAQEILGRNVSMLMPTPYREQHEQYIRDYLKSRIPKVIGFGRESVAQRKDGSIFPVELAIGEIRMEDTCRFVGIIRDVSKRKRTDNLLRQQEEELRLTLQNAPTGIATLDNQGRFLSANQAFCKMLGFTESELRRMTLRDITHPDDLADVIGHLERAFQGDFQVESLKMRYIYQTGEHVYVILHSSVVHDALGRPLRIVAQVEDITERLRLEEDARHNRERLAHLTRLSIMGEMAAGIAHEINQPLTAIASYTQACRRRIKSGRTDSEKLLELMEKVNEQALRAGEVIRRLCSLVKKRESRQEQADINELVQESVTMAKVDTRLLDCSIQLQLNSLLPKVSADPVQIQQILLNLIRNGVDAMETVPASAQQLSITTSRRDDEYDDEYVEVAVADRGVGLSNLVAEQLFSPFFTTKLSGMGMGLAICRSIITAHGGRLWFTRNCHGGVTFHFTVPIAT